MVSIQNLRGTRDFYPEQMHTLTTIFTAWINVAKRYGYEEMDGPILEPAMLWKLKSGNEIPEQMYAFKDKNNEDIALRPELTPTLARMVAAKQKELPKPIRWFSLPRCFRYEAPQKGRLREFFQLNVDLLGPNSAAADAEVIATSIDIMRELGCTEHDFYVRLGNRKLINAILNAFSGKDTKELCRLIDKREKLDEKEFLKQLATHLKKKEDADKLNALLVAKDWKKALNAITHLPDDLKVLFDQGRKELEEVCDYLKALGMEQYVQVDLSIMRGFDYYTSTVFEVFDKAGTHRAIAGGGRYDNLVADFGGDACPGVGYGMGDVVLELFLKERNLLPPYKKQVDFAVIPVSDDVYKKALEIAGKLRSKGNTVEMEVMGRKLGKAMASAEGAKNAVIVGAKDLEQGVITIKDMVKGTEKKEKISDL